MKSPFLSPGACAALLLILAPVAGASILGTAGNFTIFGGTAITSSGTVGTIIKNGNVGVSPAPTTSITGFPPAVIQNGGIVPTGAVTAKARQDLIRAQTGINGIPTDYNISGVNLGGQTLTPGVYRFNTTASLTGTLVLDGQGRNNVFWVFQIGTSLTSAAGANVVIINPGSNGGSDYGIFWNCGTGVNIAANNQIAGIYIAGTSFVFGQNSTRGGRALALAGVTLDNNQIDARGGAGGTDYSGGLMFDANGQVVPLKVAPGDVNFSFQYFGKRKRTTHTSILVVRGTATAGTEIVQWRTRGPRWHSVIVRANGSWNLKVRRLTVGKNKLQLRALDHYRTATLVKRLVVTRR